MSFGCRLLVWWVGIIRRAPLVVLALALLATILAGQFTLANISINTDTTDMLSPELPFRRNSVEIDRAFPQFTDTLSIVVEAATPGQAEDAAAVLAQKLSARPDLFHSVYYPEGDPFFRRNGLLYLDVDELNDLSNRLAEVQPLLAAINQDPTLRGLSAILRDVFKHSPDNATALALVPALDKITASVEAANNGQVHPLAWRELMAGGKVSAEDRRKFITVQPVQDFTSLEPAAAAIDAVHQEAKDLFQNKTARAKFGVVRVRMTGEPILLQDELQSVRNGMGLVGVLSTVFVVALLMLGLRSARLVVATLVTLIMGLVWTACFATLAIGELNLISVAFAVLFIGLSVDFGIHFSLRYQEAIDANSKTAAALVDSQSLNHDRVLNHNRALSIAVQDVGGAMTLCAVAAAIGFLSFLPTSYRGVSELGVISGAGMFIALFANITVLPAVLTLLPSRPRLSASGSAGLAVRTAQRAQTFITRRARVINIAALVLGLAAALTLPSARFDDDPLNLRDPKSESVATLLDLLGDPRVEPYDATVLVKDLTSAKALADRLKALPEVKSATTTLDAVPASQDEKLMIVEEMSFFLTPLFLPIEKAPPPTEAERRRALEDLQETMDQAAASPINPKLAESARHLATALKQLKRSDRNIAALETALTGELPRYLKDLALALKAETITLDNLPSAIRDRGLAADGRATVTVTPRDDLRDAAARRRFVDALQAVAPDATGAPVTITEAGRAVVKAFREAAIYTFVLITLLLLVQLRSLRDTAMVLAPLILAALMTVAATVLFQIPFNFANIIVLPLLFGLGVASGIHMVSRARKNTAVDLMATSTPRAVIFSALTTIGSFGALAMSSHRGTASMGVLLTIAITLTMLCTLVVLPALLAVFLKRP